MDVFYTLAEKCKNLKQWLRGGGITPWLAMVCIFMHFYTPLPAAKEDQEKKRSKYKYCDPE